VSATPYPASQPRVAITRAGDYTPATIRPAVRHAIELAGGLDDLVRPGQRVFVKVNLLPPPSPPERGIVTHPALVAAVIELLLEAGGKVTVGDDIDTPESFEMSGLRQACRQLGVPLVNLREAGFVKVSGRGRRLPEAFVSRLAAEADVIINLPKLKTHSLTVLTGAIKNMYGTLPASRRRALHGQFTHPTDFSQMLVDLAAMLPPHLSVMDAVQAMEGEGPGGGTVREVGLVLASRDSVALDAVAARIIGLEPLDVDTIRLADEQGLGCGRPGAIDIVGEELAGCVVADFRLPAAASRTLLRWVPPRLAGYLLEQLNPRPHVIAAHCTACGACVRVCPTGAMSLPAETATINRDTCIRCMCCHEVCRHGAIVPRRPPLGAAIAGVAGALRKLAGR